MQNHKKLLVAWQQHICEAVNDQAISILFQLFIFPGKTNIYHIFQNVTLGHPYLVPTPEDCYKCKYRPRITCKGYARLSFLAAAKPDRQQNTPEDRLQS